MQSYDSLAAVQAAIHSGAITLGHLVNTYLERIQATTNLNAFVEVFGDEAIEYARIIDKK